MSNHGEGVRRDLAPLVSVTAAAMVFTALLVLVRLRTGPLETVDHDSASAVNGAVAGHPVIVAMIKAVTYLGSNGVLWTVIGVAAIILALRTRWRLTAYLLVTGAGALVMDPVLKSLVGRLRPVVAHPIAHGGGNSFPSGHALGSIVCYGAVLLVFLPAARGRWRPAFIAVIVSLVAAIGISRILLGVHYLSDVLGAWALGITWLGITAFAFELSMRAAGEPVADPVTRGLEPDARADLRPAQPEPTGTALRHRGRIAAGIVIAWVLILGIIVGFGELITRYAPGNLLGDQAIPRWLAAHRTAGLTPWSLVFSDLGATEAILLVSVVTCAVFLGITRRWRPVIFVAVVMFGELGAFLAAAAVVKRPRPDVTHLDHHLPTSAYPSGHEAATCCLYVAIAILVIGHARGWWRWLFLIPAIAMPVLVGLSRMYRGEHHPTDILGSMLFAALWLTATCRLIRPLVLTSVMSADEEYEPSPQAWVRDQVEEYESSGGTAGTTLRDTGLPVVIITNRGVRSGKVRKTPVMRVEHDGRYAAVASQGGAPKHPLWYFNLRADPKVVVQDGAARQDMLARELSGQERDQWWERAVAAYPPYAEYQQRTSRMIPVFVLEPAPAS